MQKKIKHNDKIFVAGANGLAGSSIVRSLKKYGYGNKELGGELLTPSRKDLNLQNLIDVQKWFQKNKPDIVIVAAARVGGIFANNTQPTDFLLDNLKIQNNVIETAWLSGTRRLLFLGSNCIYPKLANQPMVEESLLDGPLEETNQWYAIAKIAGLKLCEALRKQHNFDAISVMPANLYGPGDNFHPTKSHVLPALIRRFYEAKRDSIKEVVCWGSGNPKRDFLHVDDLGDSCIFLLQNWDPQEINAPKDQNGIPLTILNIGSGEDISIKTLAEIIADATEYNGSIIWDNTKPDGHPRKQVDISQITKLGWKPNIELTTGIKSTVDYFKERIENNSFLRL
tara:strand:+ start:6319 stop:7338 length:1020 start_codon:yes stop_codon:yes gene_type:complete